MIFQAYAKMYGSYFSLSGGLSIEAAVDFTGGIPEVISVTRDTEPEILFYNLEKAFQVESLMQRMSWSRHFPSKINLDNFAGRRLYVLLTG